MTNGWRAVALIAVMNLLKPCLAFAESEHRLADTPAWTCQQVTEGLQKLKIKDRSNDKSWPASTLDPADIPRAISYLERINYPTLNRAIELVETLKSSDSKRNAEFFTTIGTDCAPERLKLVRILAATYAAPQTSVEDRKLIKSSLRRLFQIPKYPTALNTVVEMACLKIAMAKDVWTLKPEVKSETKVLEEEIKKTQAEVLTKSAPRWKKMDKRTVEQAGPYASADAVALIQKMTTTAEFSELKPVLIDEVNESSRELASIRDIDLQLR